MDILGTFTHFLSTLTNPFTDIETTTFGLITALFTYVIGHFENEKILKNAGIIWYIIVINLWFLG